MTDIFTPEVNLLSSKDGADLRSHFDTALPKMLTSKNPIMAGGTVWSCVAYDGFTHMTGYFSSLQQEDTSGMYLLI